MAAKGIGSVKDLKGKRIAVSQVGDAPYNYTIALLAKSGLKASDVQGFLRAPMPNLPRRVSHHRTGRCGAF